MLNLFSSVSVDELLKMYREFRKDISEGDACKFKFTNNGKGIPLPIQKKVEELVLDVNKDKYKDVNEETLLKIIDVLTLYANHLDQHVSEEENAKFPLKFKQEKLLSWLETAYKIAQKLMPLDKMLQDDLRDNFAAFKPEVLSSISMLLHYIGKARRYDDNIKIEARMPLLYLALSISKYLESLRKENPNIIDIHFYSSRTATFEIPITANLRQLKQFTLAIDMAKEQLKQSEVSDNYYHIIQGSVQLSDICREQFEHEKKGIKEAIDYAQNAISVVEKVSNMHGQQNFTQHVLYFNALLAAMNAYVANGDQSIGEDFAKKILSAHKENPNFAKPWHIEAATKLLEPFSTLSCQ